MITLLHGRTQGMDKQGWYPSDTDGGGLRFPGRCREDVSERLWGGAGQHLGAGACSVPGTTPFASGMQVGNAASSLWLITTHITSTQSVANFEKELNQLRLFTRFNYGSTMFDSVEDTHAVSKVRTKKASRVLSCSDQLASVKMRIALMPMHVCRL